MVVERGQIYFCNLGKGEGSEQGGYRPVVILQNNIGNNVSPTTIIAPLTSAKKHLLPTHAVLTNNGLAVTSTALLEQVRVISKTRLGDFICQLTDAEMVKVAKALKRSLELA